MSFDEKRKRVKVKVYLKFLGSCHEKNNLPGRISEEQRNLWECYDKYKNIPNNDTNPQIENLRRLWICRLFGKRFLGREKENGKGKVERAKGIDVESP